ncbi:Hypothetical predicted protein, partial [Lynx pardinus]
VSTWYHSGRQGINANSEASGAPVHKLDGMLGLESGSGRTDIYRNHVTNGTTGSKPCIYH